MGEAKVKPEENVLYANGSHTLSFRHLGFRSVFQKGA